MVRLWWDRFAQSESARGVAARRFGEDAGAASSWADAEGERGLECSVRRGWRMVLGVDMEQIAGVWRGEAQGWAVAPVPEYYKKGTLCAEQLPTRGGRCAQWRGARGVPQFAEQRTGATEARRRGRATVWESPKPKQPEKAVSVEARRGSCR